MRHILFVGSDLRARARLEGLRDVDVEAVRPEAVGRHPTFDQDLAVVDLDERGVEPVMALRQAGFGERVVGFFSHVDATLGRAAAEAGVETYPRGRFWRELESIVAGPSQSGPGSS